ncbi:MAG: EamA family transporter [Acidobacteriota bacterium]
MTPAALFVATRIVANPVSNVFQKRLVQNSADPIFIIVVTHAVLAVLVSPVVMRLPLTTQTGAFWLNMSVSAALAVAGNVLLVFALRHTDLSILASINAYKTVLSLVLGTFLIGEVPSAIGLVGVALILVGSYVVVDPPGPQSESNAFVIFFKERGVQLRFASLACSATEAVFLKRAVLQSNPIAVFSLWCVLGFVVGAAFVAVFEHGRIASEIGVLRQRWRTLAWLVISTGLMQLATLLTFGVMQVGYSLALFQLSNLVSVFFGYRYFSEQNIGRRLIGSLIMIAGAVVIATAALGHRS